MLSQLMNGLKGELAPELNQQGVDEGKMDSIMSVIGDATKTEVTKQMASGGVGGLMSLFSNNSNNSEADSIQNNITSGIVDGLMAKVGLTNPIAKTIAAKAMPVIMNLITKENSKTPDSDPSPLASLFGGGDNNDGDDGGSMLGDIAGKLF